MEIVCGTRVRILYPPYAVNLTGMILAPEEQQDGVKTGCWLVQVENQDMILALGSHEFERVMDA